MSDQESNVDLVRLLPSQDNYLITFPLGVAAKILSYKVGFKFPLLQAFHRSI